MPVNFPRFFPHRSPFSRARHPGSADRRSSPSSARLSSRSEGVPAGRASSRCSASGRLQSDRSDDALARIVAALYAIRLTHFYQPDPRNFWNLLANDPRNLFQICCLLDDSATIIKWGAMEIARDNGELGSRGERRFSQMEPRQRPNALNTAVGMVLATSAHELELASKHCGLGHAPLPMRFDPDSPRFRI